MSVRYMTSIMCREILQNIQFAGIKGHNTHTHTHVFLDMNNEANCRGSIIKTTSEIYHFSIFAY